MIITPRRVDDAVHFQAQVTLCANCSNGVMAEVLKEGTRACGVVAQPSLLRLLLEGPDSSFIERPSINVFSGVRSEFGARSLFQGLAHFRLIMGAREQTLFRTRWWL